MRAELIAAAHDKLIAALIFYADVDTYFAIGILPDWPCGDFVTDYSEHGNPNYPEGDVRPGKRAREALLEWCGLVYPEADAEGREVDGGEPSVPQSSEYQSEQRPII
jgi:hypothetical protein